MLQKQCEKLQRGEKEGGKKVIFKITCLKCERIFFFFFFSKELFPGSQAGYRNLRKKGC